MILDNLGIVIKQSEAQEEYAKSIGKTVSQLTEAEKKQALINAVVKQGKEELAAAGEVALTMAERQAQLNTTWENIKVTLGEALVPVLEKLLNFLQPILDKVADFIANNSELVAGTLKWVAGIAALVAGLSGLALALPAITTAIGTLTGPIGWVIAAIGLLATAWRNDRGGIQEKTREVIDFVKPYIEERIAGLQKFWEEH